MLPSTPASSVRVDIKNSVITFNAGVVLNCALVADELDGRFDPAAGMFPAAVSYSLDVQTSAQIFATGQVVIVGCQSETHGLLAAHQLVLTLVQRLKAHAWVGDFTTRNLVCGVSLGFPVDLRRLEARLNSLPHVVVVQVDKKSGALTATKKFDPTRFPGLSFNLRHPEYREAVIITIAIFTSGGGVATGFKHVDHMPWVREWLAEHMPQFGSSKRERDTEGKEAEERPKKKRQRCGS